MAKIGRFRNATDEAAFLRAYEAVGAEWPVSFTDLDIETSFGTTRVRRSGEAPAIGGTTRESGPAPLMLFPGITGNGMASRGFVEELSKDRVVYTPDIMGWPGRCRQTAPILDQADITHWVVEVLDGLGVERVHLAGVSFGAWMAGVVGAHRSDRLASVIMLEPSGGAFIRPRLSVLWKFLVAGLRPTDERMRKLTEWLTPGLELDENERAMVRAGRKYRFALPWERPLTEDQLRALTAPLLVLFGAATVVNDPEAVARRIRDHIPAADIEVYPGVGHEMPWAIKDKVMQRLLAFATEHDPVRT